MVRIHLRQLMKKDTRQTFRKEVFTRDDYTCKGCDKKFDESELDAHHITDRNEILSGGYVKENGITLCKKKCHIKAEKFHMTVGKEWVEGFHPDDLYKLIDSSKGKAVLMSQLLK